MSDLVVRYQKLTVTRYGYVVSYSLKVPLVTK